MAKDVIVEHYSPAGMPVSAADLALIEEKLTAGRALGDVPGHEFHGNQWTAGSKEATVIQPSGYKFNVRVTRTAHDTYEVHHHEVGKPEWKHVATVRTISANRTQGLSHLTGPEANAVAGLIAKFDPDRLRGYEARALKQYRPETLVHAAADRHIGKVSVAVRYAFAAGRRALGHAGRPNVDGAANTVRLELMHVLRQPLLDALNAGGVAAAKMLPQLVAAGDVEGHPFHGNQWTEGEGGNPRPMSDREGKDINTWGKENQRAANLTRAERLAIMEYRRATAFELNDALRKDALDKNPELKAIARHLDSAIGKSIIDKDVTVYRGVPLDLKAKVGEMLSDKGFIATTFNAEQAALNFSMGPGNKSTVMELHVSKGTHGLYTEGIAPRGFEMNGGQEHELLLGRNTSIKIIGSHKSGGITYLSGHVVKPRHTSADERMLAGPKLHMRFNIADPRAVQWAMDHAGELAHGISDTSRSRISKAIANAMAGDGIDSAYKTIEAAVGDADRAEMIARTETMKAANEGQRQAWQQAEEQGLLTSDVKKEWIATGDENVCPQCDALDGTVIGLNEEYPNGGGDGPPAHPDCRCTEGIVG